MKRIFLTAVILIFTFMSVSCVSAEALYNFNYKIESVTYTGGNNVEAEISFYVDEYIEDVNAEFLIIVAAYDNKTGRFLDCGLKEYGKRNMFSYDIKRTTSVTVSLSNLEVEEYLFKLILIENTDTLKSVAYINGNENCIIMENSFDELELSLDYSSYPMMVKSVADGNITGFVNGTELTYPLAENHEKIGITGIENEDVYEIGENDVIWYVLNIKNEISLYRHLINYDNGNYYGMLSAAGDERNNTEAEALLYNITTLTPAEVQPQTAQLCGYATAGLPYNVQGNTVELFKKVDGFSSESELISSSNIKEIEYDNRICAYSAGKTAGDINLNSFYSVITYEGFRELSMLKKVVYVYWYDTYNTFNLIIDYSQN